MLLGGSGLESWEVARELPVAKSSPGPEDWLLQWLQGACELVPCHLASLWSGQCYLSAGTQRNRCLSAGMQEGFSEEAVWRGIFQGKKAFLPGIRGSFVG